jgi:hypothetical protein
MTPAPLPVVPIGGANGPTGPLALDAPNQSFYNWLLTVCAFIGRAYDLFAYPRYVQIATPGLNSNNPQQVDAFYIVCQQISIAPAYVGQADQAIFSGANGAPGISDFAADLLAGMASPNPPPALVAAPVVVVPPPAPPVNPIGGPFDDNNEQDFTDLTQGTNAYAVGAKYTAADGTVYVKLGRSGPFGVWSWWTKLAATPITSNTAAQAAALESLPRTV